LTGEILIRS